MNQYVQFESIQFIQTTEINIGNEKTTVTEYQQVL